MGADADPHSAALGQGVRIIALQQAAAERELEALRGLGAVLEAAVRRLERGLGQCGGCAVRPAADDHTDRGKV